MPWCAKELCLEIASNLEESQPLPEAKRSEAKKSMSFSEGKFFQSLVCCGKPGNHAPWDCPHKCLVCADHLCAATFGGVCFKDLKICPTADTLKNANGGLISSAKNSAKLVLRAQDLWRKHHPKGMAKAALADGDSQTSDDEPLLTYSMTPGPARR